MKTSLVRRRLGGMLVLLLVSGVAWAQTPADIAELRVKANAGDSDAQFNLGVAYRYGAGVPQDSAQAVAWTRKAAVQGHAAAQFSLGVRYASGQSVPKDAVLAYKWYNLSAAQGTAETQRFAASNRDAIAKTMTPQQIADAQKLAREWQAAFDARQE